MSNFRKKINSSDEKNKKYPRNIEFSNGCIDFFREMADIVEESKTDITFRWYEIAEEGLPPLTIKIRKKDGKYNLNYLKENGEEVTHIQGKKRKGKNKSGGKIKVEKEFKREIKETEKEKEER